MDGTPSGAIGTTETDALARRRALRREQGRDARSERRSTQRIDEAALNDVLAAGTGGPHLGGFFLADRSVMSPRDRRLLQLAERRWGRLSKDPCKPGVAVKRHKITGALIPVPAACGAWGCTGGGGCGGRKALPILNAFAQQVPDLTWWARTDTSLATRERIKSQADRVDARYLRVRRPGVVHLFADRPISGKRHPLAGRFLTPPEALLVLHHALRPPGVRSVSTRTWVREVKLPSLYQPVGFTSWRYWHEARSRAEAEIRQRFGVHVDITRPVPVELGDLTVDVGVVALDVFADTLAELRAEMKAAMEETVDFGADAG